ncbi:MAG: hypothetical protein HUJ65_01770 [Oscillospiraceae bacterium]|nr:hypothetical protein [Oscillospiraceae bacterium]
MIQKRSDAGQTVTPAQPEEKKSRPRSKRALIVYSVILIIFVIACIMLSYAIQNRNSEKLDTLSEQNITAFQKIENLQNTTRELEEQNKALTAERDSLAQEVEELHNTVESVKSDCNDQLQKNEAAHKAEIDKLNKEITELKAQLEVEDTQN